MSDQRDYSGPDYDVPAGIIADLISLMDPWQKANLRTVRDAIGWLNEHDRPDRGLIGTTRDMMDKAKR